MTGLREARLGNENRQRDDGSFVAPVANTASRDAVLELPFTFSGISSTDATSDGTQGDLEPFTGYGVRLSTVSDASLPYILVSCDDGAHYVRLAPGDAYFPPGRFDRFFIKKPSTLPATSQKIYLDVFLSQAARFVPGFPRNALPAIGAPNVAVTVTLNPALTSNVAPPTATNVCPFRATRTKLVLKNEGVNDCYWGPAATVNYFGGPGSAGERLAPGNEATINVTGDISSWRPPRTT